MIRIADPAVWLTNINPWPKKPPPAARAADIAISTATPMATGPSATAAIPTPTPMPSATPVISCSARWLRSTVVADSDTAAAIGAKNGCACPSTLWVRYQARPAATDVWATGQIPPRSRAHAETR